MKLKLGIRSQHHFFGENHEIGDKQPNINFDISLEVFLTLFFHNLVAIVMHKTEHISNWSVLITDPAGN